MQAKRAVIFTLCSSLALLALGVAALFWFFAQLQATSALRSHSLSVLSQANQLMSALKDAETGQRGFLLTGDDAFLKPYLDVQTSIDKDLEFLFSNTEIPAAKLHLQALKPLVQAKLTGLAELIALRRNNDTNAAFEAVRSGAGMRLMAQIRTEFSAYLAVQEAALVLREASFQAKLRQIFSIILFACFCVLLLTLLFGYIMYQQSQQRFKTHILKETQALLKIQDRSNLQLKLANSTLLVSEQKLTVTLSSIGDAVIATDADACISLLNKVAETLTGWTQAQALGKPIAEVFKIISRKTREPVLIPVLETLAHGSIQSLANHTILIARDGHERDIADSCAPIRDRDGVVLGAVLVFRDVSQDHAVQQKLNDSAELIQTVLNTVADGIITLHAKNGAIEKVNPAAEAMLGYSAHDLHQKNFSMLFANVEDLGLNDWLEASQESVATRASGRGREVIGRRADGSKFPMEIAVSEMYLGGERYFTGILRDVSVRNAAEAALVAERSKLDQRLRDQQFYTRSLIESNIDALITTDPAGIITDVNKQMELLTGCSRDELIGEPFKNYFTDPERAQAGIRRVLAENRVINYELTARSRSGQLQGAEQNGVSAAQETVVSYNASTFSDRDRKLQGVFAAARDITERKRLDLVLQDNNVELTSAKLAADKANLAKSEFLSSMSHELRTPLNAILGFAQLLEVGVPLPSVSQKRSIEHILQAGWYLLDLINEILDLALIESGKLSLSTEPVKLAELLHECQSMIGPQAQKRCVQVNFPSAPGDRIVEHVYVKADRTRLKQVLINLLANAIKYNRLGGVVDLTLEMIESPHAQEQPSDHAPRLRISVKDTGAGLSPEKIAQLFQPFNRLGQEANAEEGTGIGLVVSKRLIELMQGSIGVQSSPDSGCTFWIELAIAQAANVALDSFPAEPQPSSVDAEVDAEKPKKGPTQTLLYVEDNPANMQLVQEIIAQHGQLELIEAKDAISGIELARKRSPNLILMDINLPGMSGIEALAVLLADSKTAGIPVIALSANAIPRDIEKGLAAGFFQYLTKPIKVLELLATIDLALKFAERNTKPGS